MPLTTRQRFLVRGTLVVFAVLGITAGLVVLGVFPPTANSWYPKCNLYQTTGLHCPGCGMTRAVHAALNGEIRQAVAQNVLVFVLIPYLIFYLLRTLWWYLWQLPKKPGWFRWPNWFTYLILALLLAFTVARNIRVEPFTSLAPQELPEVDGERRVSPP